MRLAELDVLARVREDTLPLFFFFVTILRRLCGLREPAKSDSTIRICIRASLRTTTRDCEMSMLMRGVHALSTKIAFFATSVDDVQMASKSAANSVQSSPRTCDSTVDSAHFEAARARRSEIFPSSASETRRAAAFASATATETGDALLYSIDSVASGFPSK